MEIQGWLEQDLASATNWLIGVEVHERHPSRGLPIWLLCLYLRSRTGNHPAPVILQRISQATSEQAQSSPGLMKLPASPGTAPKTWILIQQGTASSRDIGPLPVASRKRGGFAASVPRRSVGPGVIFAANCHR